MKRFKEFILLILGMIVLVACNPSNDKALKPCTLIGCTDGINILLRSSLPNSATIEISYNGMSKSISCAQSLCSANNIFFENIMPASFSVKVSNNGEVLHESTHSPTYKSNQPNGPDCPPDCKQAEITISV